MRPLQKAGLQVRIFPRLVFLAVCVELASEFPDPEDLMLGSHAKLPTTLNVQRGHEALVPGFRAYPKHVRA